MCRPAPRSSGIDTEVSNRRPLEEAPPWVNKLTRSSPTAAVRAAPPFNRRLTCADALLVVVVTVVPPAVVLMAIA